MLKTAYACLLLLPNLLCFCLNSRPAQADDPPTQLHQQLHKMSYTPAEVGGLLLGMPLVHVRIDDTTDAVFLVDTGASASIIGEDLARRLNLPLQPAVSDDGQPIHLNHRKEQATMTKIPLLQIGSVRNNDVPSLVLPTDTLKAMPSNVYEGIIGDNILQNSAILLDSRQHIFGFCLPGGLSPQQLNQLGLPRPYTLPLTKDAEGRWVVLAQFSSGSDSESENLLVDTGANATTLSKQLAQRIHLKVTSQQKLYYAFGMDVVEDGQIDTVHLGNLTLSNFPITIEPVSANLPPSLGMDILSGYRVLMDFPAKKMYLQPNTPSVNITVKPQATPPSQTPP